MDLNHAKRAQELLLRKLAGARSERLKFDLERRYGLSRQVDPLSFSPQGLGEIDVAVGISVRKPRDFGIAIRIQRAPSAAVRQWLLTNVPLSLHREFDVREVGRIRAASYTRRVRPLEVGHSVSDDAGVTGSIGAFVTRRSGDDSPLLLSCRHVISEGEIFQPGHADPPSEMIGLVVNCSCLHPIPQVNYVDAAVAELLEDDAGNRFPFGRLSGSTQVIATDMQVHKVGRRTGHTIGRITTFDLKQIEVDFDTGRFCFDNQIEIEGIDGDFAKNGDSGALVLDGELKAVGLFFAISQTGAAGGRPLAYANPIERVLEELEVDLIL